MKLQMHSIHFDADKKLFDFIEKRTKKLEKYYNRIIDGEVFLRIIKNGTHDNKLAEIKLNIPGTQLFAKEHSSTFEEATDLAVNAIRRQLKKHKDKLKAH